MFLIRCFFAFPRWVWKFQNISWKFGNIEIKGVLVGHFHTEFMQFHLISCEINSEFFLGHKWLKPFYQGCMEKGIQHVATQAVETSVGGGTNRQNSRRSREHASNGKVKSSWEYVNARQQNSASHQLQNRKKSKKFVPNNKINNCW